MLCVCGCSVVRTARTLAHDGTGDGMAGWHSNRGEQYTQDARRDLGARGTTVTGHAYAWNARRNAYDVTFTRAIADDKVTRYLVVARPNGVTRPRTLARFPMRVSQRNASRALTSHTFGNAYVRAYLSTGSVMRASFAAEGVC